jgi:cell division protein FtsL
MALLLSIPAVQTFLLIVVLTSITLGVIFGFISHRRALAKHQEALKELKANEEYIRTILDQLPSSGDNSLDSFRRLTLDSQLRGLIEQKKMSKLKEEEILNATINANNVASNINNQTINNYNK